MLASTRAASTRGKLFVASAANSSLYSFRLRTIVKLPVAGEAPGTLPGTGEAPGTLPGAGEAPGTLPGAGEAPGTLPGAGEAPGTLPGAGEAPGSQPAAGVLGVCGRRPVRKAGGQVAGGAASNEDRELVREDSPPLGVVDRFPPAGRPPPRVIRGRPVGVNIRSRAGTGRLRHSPVIRNSSEVESEATSVGVSAAAVGVTAPFSSLLSPSEIVTQSMGSSAQLTELVLVVLIPNLGLGVFLLLLLAVVLAEFCVLFSSRQRRQVPAPLQTQPRVRRQRSHAPVPAHVQTESRLCHVATATSSSSELEVELSYGRKKIIFSMRK
jgi:hypothetical protein